MILYVSCFMTSHQKYAMRPLSLPLYEFSLDACALRQVLFLGRAILGDSSLQSTVSLPLYNTFSFVNDHFRHVL